MAVGWHLVAFEEELRQELTSIAIEESRLLLVREGVERVTAFAGSCPHRGADLAAGRRCNGEVVCRFHGLKVSLGRTASPLSVAQYECLAFGGLVFVNLSGGVDRGFAEAAELLKSTHTIVPGFRLKVAAAQTLVVENAFDQSHFESVHDVSSLSPFEVSRTRDGALTVSSIFRIPPSPWQRDTGSGYVDVPFQARAYSPGLVVSSMGGDRPYVVLTGATEDSAGSCVVRLALAFPHTGASVERAAVEYLLRQSREGLEKDRAIWESLDVRVQEHLLESADAPVRAFRAFQAEFHPRPTQS